MALGGTNPLLLKKAAAAAAGDVVTKSLRFNRADSPSIHFTPSSDGNTKKWTTAFWFKRSTISSAAYGLFSGAGFSGNDGIAALYFSSADDGKLHTYFDATSNYDGPINDRLYRDTAGWMQIIWAVDAANTTQKIWINGVEENVGQALSNADYGVNYSGVKMELGGQAWGSTEKFDGYLAQFVHLDGQYITDPTEFGQVDATSGEWTPKELTSSSFTYGTNGALLLFEDSSDIGKDVSGKGNDFTATNLAASDVVNDTPTDNYAVLNPLVITHSGVGYDTFSEGNTKVVTDGGGRPIIPSTIFMPPDSGTYYAEFTLSAGAAMYGIARDDVPNADDCTTSSKIWGYESNAGTQYKVNSGSYVSLGTAPSYPVKNGVSYNTATGEVKFFVGGSDIGGYTGLSTDYSYGFFVGDGSTSVSTTITTHFDSDDWDNTPSGAKQLSTGNLPTPAIAKPSEHFSTKLYSGTGNTTQNITGVGFQPDLVWIKNRNTAVNHYLHDSVRGLFNLQPNTTDVEAASTNRFNSIDTDGFQVEHSGGGNGLTNGSGQTYVAWNWKAGTSPSTSHTYALRLDLTTSMGGGWGDSGSYDTPRLKVYEDRGSGNVFLGYATVTSSDDYSASYVINTNNKLAIEIVWEYDDSDGGMNAGYPSYPAGTLKDGSTTMATWVEGTPSVTDGATFIAKTSGQTASGTGTLVTWAGGATGSSYNADAGFSIVTYTGNDYDGAGTEQTIDHNLGVAPEMVIVKGRTDNYAMTAGWGVYHKDLTTDYLLYLNSNAAEAYPSGGISYINNIGATSVDFAAYYGDGFNYGGDSSYSADDYVAYFFAGKDSFSRFGKFTGTEDTSGVFVYCGFRPAMILTKKATGSGAWTMWDDARPTYNPANKPLYPNTDGAEPAGDYPVDFCSNGFVIRTDNDDINGSGETHIFGAWASAPFKLASAR